MLETFWRCGVVVILSAQIHSTKLELRFCADSNKSKENMNYVH